VIRAACAVELIHAATLVHDDVIDRSGVRRGIPTVVATGGREMAVAVGDFLFATAFGQLVENGSMSVKALSQAGSDLARGELLQRADAWQSDVSEERYLLRCRLKTARLFEAAAQLGAIASGRDPQPCEQFARSVGVAFQLLDDVLDVTGPTERTGKPRGADLLDGTVTLPWILAAREDPSLLQVDLRSLDSDSALEICERIEATGSLQQVKDHAQVLTNQARECAERLEHPTSEAFQLIATAMVERSA
jgi:octaprenyl-diphosphate synthase